MTTLVIIVFSILSYGSGVGAVLKGKYKPSIYSRLVWFLLAINSFLGVVALHNKSGSIALSILQALGCLAMLLASFKYSVKTFGITERICTLFLLASGVIWLTAHSPITNVVLSLVAHFIGGVPTLQKAWKSPLSENFFFWFFFAIASWTAYITADKSHLGNFLYALYFAVWNSLLAVITVRQFKSSMPTA